MTVGFSLLELERLEQPGLSDRERVQRIARRIIAEAGVTTPPVRVEMIASLLDIAPVERVRGLDVAGCLICNEGGMRILVRSGDPLTRQRFTICHECSHTFFPGFTLTAQFRCSPALVSRRADADLETLCDAAASELLLPRRLLQRETAAATFSLTGLEGVADRFKASLTATGSALVEMSPVPAAVLTFEYGQAPREAGRMCLRGSGFSRPSDRVDGHSSGDTSQQVTTTCFTERLKEKSCPNLTTYSVG